MNCANKAVSLQACEIQLSFDVILNLFRDFKSGRNILRCRLEFRRRASERD